MHSLPKTLPTSVRAILEPCVSKDTLSLALPEICKAIENLFSVGSCLIVLHKKNSSGEVSSTLHHAHTSSNILRFKDPDELFRLWVATGIDARVLYDLDARLSCISYSSFSWPYSAIRSTDSQLALPREYNLLFPICSELITTHSLDSLFSGYIALFFENFPQLNENLLQLITTLPAILSEVISSYLRQEEFSRERELAAFAHDLKRNLLLTEEYLRQYREQLKENADHPLLLRIDGNMTRMIQQTSRELLADRAHNDNLKIKPIPVNVNDLLTETINNLSPLLSQSKARLKLETDSSLPLLNIDPAVFPAVIENLIDNSIKYSPNSGVILVRTKLEPADTISVQVLDNGRGIAAEEWEKIFCKHYRGSDAEGSAGNGLGLYLARKIVEAHNGRIYPVASSEMKTCIKIELPLNTDANSKEKLI